MRFLAALVASCTLSQAAIAQTSECRSISDSGARLACYDKAAPPRASSTTAKPGLRAASGSKADVGKADVGKADVGKYVDTIGAEDERMNAQLKNICRGC
jgi:hypothetical protein